MTASGEIELKQPKSRLVLPYSVEVECNLYGSLCYVTYSVSNVLGT